VLRLLKMHVRGLTVFLVVESSRLSRLGGDLLQMSQLRIRLEPWTVEDIRDYLTTSLSRVGCDRSIFDESAAFRLRELTDGIPRWVSQLAELALLAAAGQHRESIDGQVIEAVYQELSASFAEDPHECAY
jgi:type II secretory pathway predicted ATPase ExeA